MQHLKTLFTNAPHAFLNTSALMKIAQSLAFAGATFGANRLARLTPREIEILRLIGVGKRLAEIASLINLSYHTVAGTAAIIREKLGAHSVRELVRLAIESRLV
jgi:two-component system, NarL family, invasion response regulator UvrY